ncbi:MAG: thiol protease/hemagglutinin PrtT [Muribaculaceae bacterium]|nr:thiol protease/hemagglutinin PrtT [Muribaculaceae bacterium]
MNGIINLPKQLLSLTLVLLMTGVVERAQAEQLTPQAALKRAGVIRESRGARGVDDTPILTVEPAGRDGFKGLYVFGGTAGFLVVSADDSGAPLLGYSDRGKFDPDSMPLALEAWLRGYAEQIYQGAQKGIAYKGVASRATWAAIAPKLTTKWDQTPPYNNQCPLENGVRTYTGCVATAMAQVMNYHKWPVSGTGSNSYTWNGETLSMDFSSVTFDWNNMAAAYGGASVTEAQKSAVATLMKACGYSVSMNYGTTESSASSLNMITALANNFGYSKGGGWAQRCFYTSDEWEELVYNELATSGPVLYDGESGTGGHQFVCDGYNGDGYFHINWGWSGMSDGYFLLSALDPESQGAGGSMAGYNFYQGIALNVHPAKSGDKIMPMMCCYGNFGTEASSYSLGTLARFNANDNAGGAGFFNFGATEISGVLGVKIVSENGGRTVYVNGPEADNVTPGKGYSAFTVVLPQSLAAGTYYVTPAFQPAGSAVWSDMRGLLSGVSTLRMTVSGRTATFAEVTPKLTVEDVKFETPLYVDTKFKLSFTATNSGEKDYYGALTAALYDGQTEVAKSTDNVTVDLKPGDKAALEYIGSFSSTSGVKAGPVYTMKLVDATTGDVIASLANVTFRAKTNASISISGFSIVGGTTVTDPKSITFTGTLNCASGYFADQLSLALFGTESTYSIASTSTDVIFLKEGESAQFTVKIDFSQATSGSKYAAAMFYKSRQMTNGVTFTVSTNSALEDVAASEMGMKLYPNPADSYVTVTAEKSITALAVYSMSGALVKQVPGGGNEVTVDVSGLAPGVYIVELKTSDGKVSTNRLIRK